MRQFLRKTRVTFFGSSGFIVNPSEFVERHELRVAFEVDKTISGSANKFEIKVWNLNADHRNSIGNELDEVQLEAGYVPPEGGGNLGIIASGFVRDVQHECDGPDVITTVTCGDGDKAHRKSTVSKTYPSGTKVETVVESLFSELEKNGVKRGEWVFPEGMKPFARPYSICGGAVRELNVLGRSHRFYWSIQNGVMEIIPADGKLPGIALISAETGMIGSPTITDNGVKVMCLLNPEIRPNRTVKVVSNNFEMNAQDSTFRVSKVTFQGDNTEGDFMAHVHSEAVKDGKVDEGVLNRKKKDEK